MGAWGEQRKGRQPFPRGKPLCEEARVKSLQCKCAWLGRQSGPFQGLGLTVGTGSILSRTSLGRQTGDTKKRCPGAGREEVQASSQGNPFPPGPGPASRWRPFWPRKDGSPGCNHSGGCATLWKWLCWALTRITDGQSGASVSKPPASRS